MVKQIFVSHSRHDKEIVASFDRVFARTGVKSLCTEFEAIQSPKWMETKTGIEESETVFLLISQNITENSFTTQNWIAFEVGLACALGKDIWVFEQIASKIVFPIPYVTDYMRYESLEKREVFDYIRTIVEGYSIKHRIRFGEKPLVMHSKENIKYIPKGKVVKLSLIHI